jgi:hypothetical protein
MKIFGFFLVCVFYSFFIFSRSTADLVSFASGVHSICRDKYMTEEFRVEYKFHQEVKHFRPFLGVMATLKGAVYAYGGIALDLVILDKVIFSPNFAAGYYNQGGGRDLGYPLEFRSGIDVGWKFKNLNRLGVNFCHISNASLGHRNPGVESLVVFYSFPVGKVYKQTTKYR